MSLQKMALRSLWWKKFTDTTFTLLDTTEHGMAEVAQNQLSATTPVYGRQADGKFVPIMSINAVPGDFNSFQLTFLESSDVIHPFLKQIYEQKGFYLERLSYTCPPLDNRALWSQLEFFKVAIDSGSRAAGPIRDGSDGPVESNITVKALQYAHLKKTSLAALTTTETEDIFSVGGVKADVGCLSGYPGPDKILFFGADDDGSSAPGNLLYSMNGGGTIAAVGTDATPFDEVAGINNILADIISDTAIRVIVSRETATGVKAMFAYADVSWTGTTITVPSWNVITIAATATAAYVEKMYWYRQMGRLYIVAAGDVYVSLDNGETDPGTAIYTGTAAIAGMTIDEDKNVWAVGASNTILRELASNRGVFAARTGPSEGGAFTAIAFDADGNLYAGNGTTLYKNTDKAGSTGGWTALYNAGTAHAIRAIQCKNGTSQCLRIVVDDSTPGTGSILESEDGGSSWRLITELTNTGYNAAYFTEDINKAIVVGDGGVIQLLS